MGIWVRDSNGNGKEAPFSKMILARSIMRTGLADIDSYELAESINNELQKNKTEVSNSEIFKITKEKLKRIAPQFAERYKVWHEIEHLKTPIFILLGGASGTGTTTVASELGHLLNIRRVIGTDIIRDVMRKMVSKELVPALHASTYQAWKYIKTPVAPETNKETTGFRLQSEYVGVGLSAVLERAIHEGVSIIIEGIHVLPETLKKSLIQEPNVFLYILKVSDEDVHKRRFKTRADSSRRKAEQYLENYYVIREIQGDIVNKAKANNIPVMENSDINKTVGRITEDVMIRMIEMF